MKIFKKTVKSTKIEPKDPIKDKYKQEIGFFKKIQINLNKKKELYNSNKELKEEVKSFISIVLGIGLYGLLGGLGTYAVIALVSGASFSLTILLGIGSLLWLIENKFIEFITRILGSIKLVSINQ